MKHYDLIEDLKSGKSAFYKYTNEQLIEQSDLMHLAVKNASLPLIKYLVEERGVSLFNQVGEYQKLPFSCIKDRSKSLSGSSEEVSLYLLNKMKETNPSWAIQDSKNYSTLDSVIDNFNLTNNQKKEIIVQLLESGADINKSNEKGYPSTALGRALYLKNDEIAKFLIDVGANPYLLEPTIGKPALAFDSTGETKNYVSQMQNPITIDKESAMAGLLKEIENNNISEIKRHLDRPEFRQLKVNGKNLYETAQQFIPSISEEMNELLKNNMIPTINRFSEEQPLNRILSIRNKSIESTNSNNLNSNSPY